MVFFQLPVDKILNSRLWRTHIRVEGLVVECLITYPSVLVVAVLLMQFHVLQLSYYFIVVTVPFFLMLCHAFYSHFLWLLHLQYFFFLEPRALEMTSLPFKAGVRSGVWTHSTFSRPHFQDYIGYVVAILIVFVCLISVYLQCVLKDAMELDQLISYLINKEDSEGVVLLGHSTGCQVRVYIFEWMSLTFLCYSD